MMNKNVNLIWRIHLESFFSVFSSLLPIYWYSALFLSLCSQRLANIWLRSLNRWFIRNQIKAVADAMIYTLAAGYGISTHRITVASVMLITSKKLLLPFDSLDSHNNALRRNVHSKIVSIICTFLVSIFVLINLLFLFMHYLYIFLIKCQVEILKKLEISLESFIWIYN